MRLRAHQGKDELMILLIQARRVDDVGGLDGVGEIEDRNPGSLHPGHVRDHVKLRNAAALDCHGADADDTVDGRFERVSGKFPEPALRESGRGQAVAENRKRCEREPVCGDFCC